jgi:hypothetical protein
MRKALLRSVVNHTTTLMGGLFTLCALRLFEEF